MPKRTPPELTELRRHLRQAVQVRLDRDRARNDHTATTASELLAEIEAMKAAGAVQRARQACASVGVKVPVATERLAVRYTKAGWMTEDGRRVTKSERYPNTGYVNAPAGAAWDDEHGRWL